MHSLLIVDDEWLIREGLQKTVPWNDWGIEVAGAAKNGFEALNRLEEIPIDILLTDIRMPKMNGIELIEICKQKYPMMKIVLLSGHDEFSYAQKALRLGISDFLLKPTDFNELQRVMLTISQELKMAQQNQESILQSLLKSILANPGSEKIEELMQVPDFSSAYGVMLFSESEIQNDFMSTKNFVKIDNKDNESIYFFYNLKDDSFWDHLVDKQIHHLTESGFKGTMKVSSLSDDINQLYNLYLQATTAALPIHKGQCFQSFQYDDEKRKSTIIAAINYVTDNMDKALNQTELARELHMSNSNFSKLFKQYTGMNFVDFITEKRINKAKELLTYTNLKTSEIAQKTGYVESRYFNQLFKKKVGCSPREFREKSSDKNI